MKVLRRILYVLTAFCCAAAVWMLIRVSGMNLLTEDSNLGRILALSYRWVTLAAAVLLLLSVISILIMRRVHRRKRAGRLKRKTAAKAWKPCSRDAPACEAFFRRARKTRPACCSRRKNRGMIQGNG